MDGKLYADGMKDLYERKLSLVPVFRFTPEKKPPMIRTPAKILMELF